MGGPSVSIVIPAYNESKRIGRCVQDVQSFFKASGADLEVLIVVEKSSDDTANIARKNITVPFIRVIENQVHKGKGYAVRQGMLQTQGEIVFFMDADLSTPLAEVYHFLGHFKEHPETHVVIGNRQHQHSEIIKRQISLRQKMGQTFNFFVHLFAIQGIKDTQCGFKAFRKQCVKPVFENQKLNGFAFDVEVLMLARALNYKIDELPVKWINSPDSKVRIVQDSLKMLRDLIRSRWIVRRTLASLPKPSGG